jgi:hypothetical protein
MIFSLHRLKCICGIPGKRACSRHIAFYTGQ